ncbi:uncharacterized protein LOC125950015 [Anopheles darlingi]|uniref:uncharacterized protein LOC125950015 n=1 Tax=Anopheles darlingi TaxID=43151 RepID=UPI00210015FA|nr:uncharacterized protein LOC125950015 [Anopheles darlingi]
MSASTSKTTTSKAVKSSRAAQAKPPPSTLHGTDYQLKITLWILLIAKQNMSNRKYSKCSITAEDPLGGKFDDTVLHFQLPDGRDQALYIQAKHKHDTAYRITSGDLLSASDSAFSVMKYFKSFCALHHNGRTDGARFVVCTNAGVSQDVMQVLEKVVHASTDDITTIFYRVGANIYRFHKEQLRNIDPFKSFLADVTIDSGTSDLLDQFFEQFLLICNVKGTVINNDIIELWRCLDVSSNSLFTQQMGLIEQAIALDHLSSVAWTMTKFSKTKSQTDIEHICQAIVRNLCFLQLKGATSIFCKSFENSDVSIKSEALKQSKAYRACLAGGVHEYCAMLDTEVSCNIILQIVQLVECEYIFTNSKTYLELACVIKDMFCSLECHLVLVIVCEKDIEFITRSVEEFFKDSATISRKTVILITPSEGRNITAEEYHVCDLNDQAQQRLFENYSQMKLFYAHVSLENLVNRDKDNLGFIVRLIKIGETEKSKTHPAVESFEKIKTIYINRSWEISETIDHDKYSWSTGYFLWATSPPTSVIRVTDPQRFDKLKLLALVMGMTQGGNRDTYNNVIQQAAKPAYTLPPGMDISHRVHIFLDEAGFGKTTYMTWVAWYFVNHRQSSWVIRLNAIEYSFDFRQILNDYGPVSDSNTAVRVLFQLIYLALSIPNLTTKTMEQTDTERRKAKRWAECLTLSEGKVVVNGTRDDTVEQQIALRVFREKFNKKEIVLLLDGFDEIAPHYKQVVLNLFSHFAQFEGIHRLYFTSRPYNFIDELKDALKVTNIYRIDPFSTENLYEFLHRHLTSKIQGYINCCLGIERYYLWQIIVEILGNILGQLCVIPLFLKMALDILTPRLEKTISFENRAILPTFFQELPSKYGRSRILEEFVNLKLDISNYDKFGASDTAAFVAQRQMDAKLLNELKKNDLSLLAIYTIIPSDYQLMTRREQEKCEQILKKIEEGSEKSGIIDGVQGGVPVFIHRMFAEYFAAFWLFENRDRHEVKLFFKSKYYWGFLSIPVRKLFDEIAIRDDDGTDSPAHLAIILNDETDLEKVLKKNVNRTDAIGRTLLHLSVQYHNKMGRSRHEFWPMCLEAHPQEMQDQREPLFIDAKDDLLHWSALDYAFCIGNWRAIKYLLNKNASINATALSEQLQRCDPCDAYETLARYDTYLMDFVYDIDEHKPLFPHSASQIETMRTVCNIIVTNIKNNHSEWFEANKTKLLLKCAKTDSVILLRSLLELDTELFTTFNQTSIIREALNECSFHVLGFLIHDRNIDISGVIEADHVHNLLKCCAQNGYEKWFTYFLNFCSFLLNVLGRTRWDSRMLELLFGSKKY